ncbi:hypothetical protein Dimus_038820 [Dionaea muscipula]
MQKDAKIHLSRAMVAIDMQQKMSYHHEMRAYDNHREVRDLQKQKTELKNEIDLYKKRQQELEAELAEEKGRMKRRDDELRGEHTLLVKREERFKLMQAQLEEERSKQKESLADIRAAHFDN